MTGSFADHWPYGIFCISGLMSLCVIPYTGLHRQLDHSWTFCRSSHPQYLLHHQMAVWNQKSISACSCSFLCWCLLDSAWAEIADILPRNESDYPSLLHRLLGMGQVEVVIPKTTKEKELLHDWRANKKLNSECFD